MTKDKQRNQRLKQQHAQQEIAAKNLLKKLFAPVKKSLYLAWFFDVLMVLCLFGQAWVLMRIFDAWLMATMQGESFGIDWRGVGFLAMMLLLRAVIGCAKDRLISRTGLLVAGQSRRLLLDKLAQMGMARRAFGTDAVLASKIIDEPEHLVGFARFEVQKMTAVSTPILILLAVFLMSKMAALILFITLLLVPMLMVWIGKKTGQKSREQMDTMAQLGGRFFDWIRGMNTLARLNAQSVAVADIANSAENYRKTTMSVLRVAFLNSAVLEFFSAISIALVAIYLGLNLLDWLPAFVSSDTIDYATALFILLIVPEFYAPLRRLGLEYHAKGQAMAAADAMVGMMGFKSINTGKIALNDLQNYSIILNKVTAFGDDGRLRLAPTSLQFDAGKITALKGESGIGKSTILQLLLGFGQYTGEICFDDGKQRYRHQDLDIDVLRQQFGYLSQVQSLLPMSIADNLRLAKPNASDDELLAVLAQVGLSSLLERLPNGIHTVLGERGAGISGGQAQRLAVAQILLSNAKIWLLDEPTEHLDGQTALQIEQLLKQAGRDKTVIWVTHATHEQGFDVVHRLGATTGEMA